MKEIHQAQQALDHARDQLKLAVQQARDEGHTWAAIGDTLGMSRQAAFKRFGEVTNPVTGRTRPIGNKEWIVPGVSPSAGPPGA